MNRITALLTPVLLVCLILSAAPVLAGGQPPLTEAELDRIVADWPALAAWAEKKSVELDGLEDPSALAALQANAEMASFLKDRGWTQERFFHVLGAVATGWMVVTAEEQRGQVVTELEAQKKELAANQDLPAETKKQLMDQMDQAISQARAAEESQADAGVAEADLDLIRANMDKLHEMMSQ